MKLSYLAGQWVEGTRAVANLNPSDLSDIEDTYSLGDERTLEAAVTAARAAAPAWAATTPQQRFDLLDRIGTDILARKAELGDLLAREEGKTLPEAIGEVARAGQIFKFFAGEALRQSGQVVASVRPGVRVEVERQPLGVVGLISPWNFPIAIPAWKVAPALAFGNTVVLKAAEATPGCAHALARLFEEAGAAPGLFNLVLGEGRDVGAALVAHRDVDAISFTGSVQVGATIAATCVARGAKFQLEMGGKNPMVVLDDADLETAVAASLNGAFFSTGQRCTASSRLIVTDAIHDRFVAALLEAMTRLKIGDAREPGTQIGPVVDQRQLDKNLAYLELGRREGARLHRGQQLQLAKQGYYLEPALFTESTNLMRINREEIFGPIAAVIRVRDYDEALAVANDTPFGLSAGICTTSLKFANHFRQHAQAGMVMINLPTAGVDYHVPFGGRKASSYGPREQGSYAAEFYTTVKTTYVAP